MIFQLYLTKKWRYWERMESADSNTSIERTNKNSVSTVGAEKVSK
ncbi:hypothetical protein HMPREF1548_05762 [Clostridium sp. KLE 1755]|nr:hypothetical protein HMPREF1548_05762 [Clostridium sp. KLE 1755]